MSRAAQRCAGWAAGFAVALSLAACGGSTHHIHYGVAKLCVAVGLPTSGAGSVVGKAVLSGLQREIPAGGFDVDGFQISLCGPVGYNGGRSQSSQIRGLLRNAEAAAEQKRIIAWVGALPGTSSATDGATLAGPILADAGIPVITPSGPEPAASVPVHHPSGGVPDTIRSTTFYLQPSVDSQLQAESDLFSSRTCFRSRRKHPATCGLSPSDQLCTGITEASSPGQVRLCVLAGPDLSSFDSPAVAYGESAGALLRDTFEEVVASGGDISSRTTVLRRLGHEDLKDSPIGPIRFDSGGGITADVFTVYTVQQDGRLVNTGQTIDTH